MKPTIRSLARMCGVSRGTVDRVLNDRPYVKPEVRQRVLRAVQQTGYVHPSARAQAGAHATHIGFLMAQWENAYFREQTARGIRRAERYLRPGELKLTVETMVSRSEIEYLQRIDRLLDAGTDGILLNAADTALLRGKIDELDARGVPVVTYNSDLPSSRRVCHVGQDLAKSGRVAAGLLAGLLGPQDTVLAVTGNLEFRSHRSRVESFCRHLEGLGVAGERLTLRECFERYDLTYQAVWDALQADPRLRGIYMGTEHVPACIDAIRKARPRHKIHVIVNDLTPMATRYLKSGDIDFVIEQDFAAQAYEAILVLYALLAHDRPPKKPVRYVTTSIYTRELLETSFP